MLPVAVTSAVILVGCLLALVDPLEVGDELGCDAAPGPAGGVAWTDLGQQGLGLSSGEVLLRSTRDQLEQLVVQLGDDPGVVLAQ